MGLTKNIAKQVLSSARLFDVSCNNSLCVFLYHDVSENPSELSRIRDLNVPPGIFEQQIDAIGNHFNIISPQQFIEKDFETPAALITFDDGWSGYFENAAPILEEFKCPSVAFLNMATIDGEISWDALLNYLLEHDSTFVHKLKTGAFGGSLSTELLSCTREEISGYLEEIDARETLEAVRGFCGKFATRGQLSAAEESGYVFLGNHLYNHYNAVALTETELRDAYLKNHEELAHYSNAVNLFSYPFGQPHTFYTQSTNDLILGLGAQAIFSATPALNFSKDQTLLHRITLSEGTRTDRNLKEAIMGQFLRGLIKQAWPNKGLDG